ncbi:hypothetical protein J3458_007208 [Metarhizium acridum]|uniref:uncharacterized protein n=1 Tax=Metarhizium acridum TaxID=92637 RepID=UPI001C6CAB99|nr:hypothetical protein J3458_007208 [Metarhizium acridum]
MRLPVELQNLKKMMMMKIAEVTCTDRFFFPPFFLFILKKLTIVAGLGNTRVSCRLGLVDKAVDPDDGTYISRYIRGGNSFGGIFFSWLCQQQFSATKWCLGAAINVLR